MLSELLDECTCRAINKTIKSTLLSLYYSSLTKCIVRGIECPISYAKNLLTDW